MEHTQRYRVHVTLKDESEPAPAVVSVARVGGLTRYTVEGGASLYVDDAGELVKAIRTCGRAIPLDRVPGRLMDLLEGLKQAPLAPGCYIVQWEPLEVEE